ncbi:hypothetical protein D3C73_1065570 [compost metagenome]
MVVIPQSSTFTPTLVKDSVKADFKLGPDNLESIPNATFILSLLFDLFFKNFAKPTPSNFTISGLRVSLYSSVSIAIPLISVPFFSFFNVSFVLSSTTLHKLVLMVISPP